jgi:hypothetical protein
MNPNIHKELRHLSEVKLGQEPEQTFLKGRQWARDPWLTTVILATCKAEIRRISIQAQPGEERS